MAARVRNVLYWLGTIVAVLAIGGVIFLFGVIFLCGLIVYGICRAARYVLRGPSQTVVCDE